MRLGVCFALGGALLATPAGSPWVVPGSREQLPSARWAWTIS